MIAACKEIRKNILQISHASGHGHIPSCFSVVEALWSVYHHIRHAPSNPAWEERDIFILSKGHASLAHYCTLAHLGYFPLEEVYRFGGFRSDFGCHANRLKVPGIEASTGSLAHGIGISVGIALSLKLKGTPRNVYTLIGDGEANEGTVWESVLVAVNLQLDNLTIIYDNNQSHSRGLQIKEPGKKFKAFGCKVDEIDGHDVEKYQKAFHQRESQVQVIVANTVKGFGCPTLAENHYEWHRKSPTKEQLDMLLEELDETAV